MGDLAQVLDEMHAREQRDDIWAEGSGYGYATAKAEVEALLDAKGPAAAKLKAIRAWVDDHAAHTNWLKAGNTP